MRACYKQSCDECRDGDECLDGYECLDGDRFSHDLFGVTLPGSNQPLQREQASILCGSKPGFWLFLHVWEGDTGSRK